MVSNLYGIPIVTPPICNIHLFANPPLSELLMQFTEPIFFN